MKRFELIKILLGFDLDNNHEASHNLVQIFNERSVKCFFCHRCFTGFGDFIEIINPELNKRCNDIWLDSEI